MADSKTDRPSMFTLTTLIDKTMCAKLMDDDDLAKACFDIVEDNYAYLVGKLGKDNPIIKQVDIMRAEI